MAAWTRLANIFQDNKHARAVHLEDEFSHVRLANFASISAYCQQLRTIATNLANVGAPVEHNRVILRLVNGLTAPFATVASMIQQTIPLPTFENARSILLLEEGRQAHSVEHESHSASAPTALVHADNPPPPQPDVRGSRGRSNPRGGRGRSSSRGGRGRGRTDPQPPAGQWPFPPPPWAYWMPSNSWNTPPCPYPTTAWPGAPGPSHARPNSSAGILGPRPAQAHFTAPATPGFVPTDLHNAMQTMSITPPDDQWYMDTGATSHMTANPGSQYGHTNHEMQ
ncbi:unnamed protein product [Cuscuta epithymum]|uniref:Uncharacterized protein n=1 Tax=Cuscuta epithymum TaxID=186058 RepID=A0AAV0G310_9ASTE|nr:unnamed protein product [Cuscuta epithymum]